MSLAVLLPRLLLLFTGYDGVPQKGCKGIKTWRKRLVLGVSVCVWGKVISDSKRTKNSPERCQGLSFW